MASTQTSLDAAAQERKARLAKLKSLKRKQPEDEQDGELREDSDVSKEKLGTVSYLSGRNYDAATRGPKLGFENTPIAGQDTLEQQAQSLSIEAKKQAADEEKADQPVDLFKLQPKRPDWDLKRDMERKLDRLNVQTDNAIARIVRERIAAQKKQKAGELPSKHDGEDAGLEGEELVEAMHQREREDEQSATDSEGDS